ncbi:MAG: hypothetical protein M3247_08000 [Thermoproteota archaeon]|nr:hypothetical protein [Thermoproteota archaeon]
MMKNIKQRMLNAIAAHPRIVTYGIGLAIATVVGIGLASLTGGTGLDHLAYATKSTFNNQQNFQD